MHTPGDEHTYGLEDDGEQPGRGQDSWASSEDAPSAPPRTPGQAPPTRAGATSAAVPEDIRLANAPIEHLRSLRSGSTMVLAGYFTQVGGMLVGIVSGIILASIVMSQSAGQGGNQSATLSPVSDPLVIAIMAVTSLISLIAFALVISGWLRIAKPDPRGGEADVASHLRVWLAISGVLMVVLSLSVGSVDAMAPVPTSTPNSPFAVFTTPAYLLSLGLTLLSGIAAAAFYGLAMAVMSRINARIDYAASGSLSSVLVWLVPVLMTVGLLACGLGPLAALVLLVIVQLQFSKDIKALLAQATPGDSGDGFRDNPYASMR